MRCGESGGWGGTRAPHFLNHSNVRCPFAGHQSAIRISVSTAAIPPVKAAHQGVDAAHQGDAANGGPGDALKQALVPSPQGMTAETAPPANPFAHRLPVELEVALPLRNFRVRN